MNKPRDSDRALRHLCELARAAFTEDLSASEQAGWSRLEAKMSGRPRSRHPLAVGLGLAAAAAAVVLLALGSHRTPPSLGFRVIDEAGVPHAAPDLASAGRIEFSDGSQVTLTAEARASVTAIDARGAHIRLEHGRLSAHFVQLPNASWSIAAGPYQVQVTGTAFDVSWTPEARALELWLRHGSVLVKGPNAGQGIAVVGGPASLGQRGERANRPRCHGTRRPPGSAHRRHRADAGSRSRAGTLTSLRASPDARVAACAAPGPFAVSTSP